MITSLELENKRIWIEVSVVVDKKIREYEVDNARVIEIDRIPKRIEIESTIEERELAEMITRNVAWMVEKGYNAKQIVKRIAEIYGMDEHDAMEFYRYAEWYLFS
ncbi:hypothetical protein Asulf_01484 [Archaeoglobus sulfaticallidus PM70-1]|uniref:Uncharacterized protein n=1 Tax=Archaeoglobus sulfaticallidus PM70-1 TaxID=387631 RepID=N0BGR6_9EURY|nr:hypothetical protein [Archaeoglobus sulfaticallidus]AGK61467.1 hypothetical protein Asulf_01484 [Archaeoglobus sulfaticallidus PM70-1]